MEILRLKKESYIYIHPITKIITFFSCSFIMMSSGERLVENLILCLLLILLLKAKFYKLFIKLFILCSFLACTEFAILKLQMPVIILSLIKFVKMFIPIIISYYLLAKGTTGL